MRRHATHIVFSRRPVEIKRFVHIQMRIRDDSCIMEMVKASRVG
jgi:hypothetical protein